MRRRASIHAGRRPASPRRPSRAARRDPPWRAARGATRTAAPPARVEATRPGRAPPRGPAAPQDRRRRRTRARARRRPPGADRNSPRGSRCRVAAARAPSPHALPAAPPAPASRPARWCRAPSPTSRASARWHGAARAPRRSGRRAAARRCPRTRRAAPSWRPAGEALEQRKARRLRLLRVELDAQHRIPAHDGGERGAVLRVGEVGGGLDAVRVVARSEEHTSELQSPCNLVCRLLLEKKKKKKTPGEERDTTMHSTTLYNAA